MSNILDLLPELHEKIYSYCYGTDLLNLSCCNSTYNDSLKYIIWQRVRIPWGALTQKWTNWFCFGNTSMKRRLCNLKYTTHLTFYRDGSEDVEDEIQWTNICTNYERILTNSNPDSLLSLSLEGVIDDEGMSTTCKLLTTLQELSLESCSHLTMEGWRDLASLKNLCALSITKCELSYDIIKEICNIGSLSRLQIHKNPGFDGTGLLCVSEHFQDLQRLTITYIRNLDKSGFGSIGKLKLTHLDLRYTNINNEVISIISTELPMLKVLIIRGCFVGTDGLKSLLQLKRLEELDVNGVLNGGFGKEQIQLICSLTSLRKLDLSHNGRNLTSESLLLIDNLNLLEELCLGWNRCVTDSNLSIISHLEFLHTLDVRRCAEVSDVGLRSIGAVKSLREINLNSCVLITDTGFSELVNIECLENIDVGYTSITDVGLLELGKLRVLSELNITGCSGITDAGIAHLGSSIYLKKLNISHTTVTDHGISHLQSLIYLKKLDVNSCANLTNNSLHHIGKLLSLERLCIGHNVHFDNAGLEQLRFLRSLRKLKCWHTNIDENGLRKLAGCTLLKKVLSCKT